MSWKQNSGPECKKFKPNIFNKNKCANCYRDRTEHSDEALEVNKATRIVSKCGYLFVAPNWDFTNPVYRTKRWQRRWFVLYDDGELTYSVDDHYDTVPQAVINLNNVFEITEADAITGNENSIAIVANDGIHFCKGTCREESQMWLDILRLFPQVTILGPGRISGNGGRAKRSATFPGIRNLGTNFMSPASRFANNKAANANANALVNKSVNKNNDIEDYDEEIEDLDEDLDEGSDIESQEDDEEPEEVSKPLVTTGKLVEKPPQTPISSNSSKIIRKSSEQLPRRPSRISGQEDIPMLPPTPPNTSPPASPCNPKTSPARPPNPLSNSATKPPTASVSKTSTASINLMGSSVSGVQSITSGSGSISTTPPHSRRGSYHRPTLSSEYRSSRSTYFNSEEVATAAAAAQRRRPSASGGSAGLAGSGSTVSTTPPSRGSSHSFLGLSALQNNRSQHNLQKKDSISSTESLSPSPSESRGTPDGCGLDLVNSSPELLTKKGWLMKQGLTKEWHKYWFVLQDVALLYYRDPKAESKGFLDGIIDLSLVQQVEKTDLPRNFGFSIHTFEGKNIVFSAITDGIRNNWITCLRKAANLPAEDSKLNSNNKPILTKRSSSFSDSPMTITTTKIVRSSTSNVLIPPKVPEVPTSKSLTIPKLTTTPSSSNEQDEYLDDDDDEEDSSDYEDDISGSGVPTSGSGVPISASGGTTSAGKFHNKPASSNTTTTAKATVPIVAQTVPDHVSRKGSKFDPNAAGYDIKDKIKTSTAQDGVIVDLLDTEVDSLQAKLELTQSELYSLHNSNLDLTTQLRKTQAQQIQPCTATSKYSFSNSSGNGNSNDNSAGPSVTSMTSVMSSMSSVSKSSISTTSAVSKASPAYDKSAYLEDELARTQKELAKQASEVLSLKNQLSLKQITLQQNLQTLEDVSKDRDDTKQKFDKTKSKLDEATTKLDSQQTELDQSNQRYKELSTNLQHTKESLDKEVGKWKLLYDSLYNQYDNELHTWEENLSKLETQRDERETAYAEETRRKDRVVSDLSDQFKESEDRIQELQIELEACKEANEALKHHSEESFSRLVVSMEEKFEESLKAEKEQMEVAFKLKAKDHDLYDRLASSPVTTRSNSRRASLVKISSMSDLLALKAPTLDSLESMGPEQVKQKFIVLMDHFYAAVDEIRALRARLSKAQDTIDAMEIDKLRFEESFKRTIVMQEQQENLMSKRIQDLTNKLLVSEKTVRQLKERKHSRKHSIAHAANHRQQHHIQATHSDSGTTDT